MASTALLLRESNVERVDNDRVRVTTPPVHVQATFEHRAGRDFFQVGNGLCVRADEQARWFLLVSGHLRAPGEFRLNHFDIVTRALEALRDPQRDAAEADLAVAQAKLREAQEAVARAEAKLR